MAEFNPIIDLMPMDSSEESVDESSEQIKVIRTQLIETRNSVVNVLNIIKVKNSLLDRDLDKIKSLNDRLLRTIPRIPIMRGKAGVQFGDTIEEEKKKGGLNIPRFPPRSRSKEKVVTYARPGLKKNLDRVGNILNTITNAYFLKNLVTGAKNLVRPGANNIVPVTPGVLTPKKEKLIERVLSFFKTRKLSQTSQKSGFAAFSKNADKVKFRPNFPLRFTPANTKLEVERYVTQLQRATTGKTKFKFGVEGSSTKFSKIEILHASNRADLKIMLEQRKNQLKTLTPGTQAYKDMEKSIRLVENGIKRINNSFKTYYDQVKQRAKTRIRLEEKDRKMLEKSTLRRIIEGEYYDSLDDLGKKLYKGMVNQGDEFLDFLKGFGPGASINAKPMSNDIAMLNTDTGVTNNFIFITDTPPPTTV